MLEILFSNIYFIGSWVYDVFKDELTLGINYFGLGANEGGGGRRLYDGEVNNPFY